MAQISASHVTSHSKLCHIRRMNEAKKLYTNKSRDTSIIDHRAGRLRLKGEKGAAENAAPTACRHSPPSADPPWLPNLNHQLCSYLTHITSTTHTHRQACTCAYMQAYNCACTFTNKHNLMRDLTVSLSRTHPTEEVWRSLAASRMRASRCVGLRGCGASGSKVSTL